jgi:hypothetical protein
MISYSKTAEGKTEDFLLLVNFERGANVIPVSEVEAASSRPGMDKIVPYGQIAGMDVTSAPLAGVMRVDNLDAKSFIVVRRQLEKDALQLVTIGKELSFRLSDHLSEYAFQEFSYKGDAFQLKYVKPRLDMILKDEGFADHIKPSE